MARTRSVKRSATTQAKRSTTGKAKRPAATRTRAKTAKTARQDAPWERDNPKGDAHKTLKPAAKAAAKRRAKKAGRPYPNLVDNMRAASSRKKR